MIYTASGTFFCKDVISQFYRPGNFHMPNIVVYIAVYLQYCAFQNWDRGLISGRVILWLEEKEDSASRLMPLLQQSRFNVT